MRVKVGDTWHSVTADQPICVELTAKDRENIANMHPEATRYAAFADDDLRDRAAKLEWME